MLQQDVAEDFVIATGTTTTVRDFVTLAFQNLGIELEFQGEGINEVTLVSNCTGEIKLPIGKEILSIDKNYFRPTEVDLLLGDPSKAREKLGWSPKHTLSTLVKHMVEEDLKFFKKEKYLKENGHKISGSFE